MFGGTAVDHRGLIVAIDHGGGVLFKAGAADARRWTYEGRAGKPAGMPSWSVPDAAFDAPDAMARRVRLAWEAAMRASSASGKSEGRGAATRPLPCDGT